MAKYNVIGIGCSAGGVEALKEIFPKLPKKNAAYVVVQHLSPSHDSLMTQILSRLTDLEVVEAEGGEELSEGKVYLTPPGKLITIEEDCFKLEDQDPEHDRTPLHTIDAFLKSLAENYEDQAVAVIMSGSGSDGVSGCRHIKEKGGFVLVQNPKSAQFSSMPESVKKEDLADVVVELDDIPGAIERYIETYSADSEIQFLDEEAERSYYKILDLVQTQTGFDFVKYRDASLQRRLRKRLGIHGLENLKEYEKLVSESPEEIKKLGDDFLIGVTSFFRDPNAFQSLRENALKELIESSRPGSTIRIWVPACSTGQEAYSIAMQCDSLIKKAGSNVTYRVFGTDINKDAIATAQRGVYPIHLTGDIPSQYFPKYFDQINDDAVAIGREIRDSIVFSRHDIIADPPFSKMDVISFRNCSIYLKKEVQKDVLALLEHSLNTNGFLFLGSSEGLRKDSHLTVVDNLNRLYKKEVETPVKNSFELIDVQARRISSVAKQKKELSKKEALFLEVGHQILSHQLPPSVLVNKDGSLLHVFGSVSKFTNLQEGSHSGSFFELLNADLKNNLLSAFSRAVRSLHDPKTDSKSEYSAVHNSADGLLVLTVKRIESKKYEDTYLITFKERETKNVDVDSSNTELDEEEIRFLKKELDQSRKDLDYTVENLETTNEELQSTNEELVTSNEELQSTNEELQSVNEELHTMNSEFQDKIEELSQLNQDIEAILSIAKVGTLFLDENLKIRKISKKAMQVLELKSSDEGRRITQFSNTLYDNFIEDCERTLTSSTPIEKQIRIDDFGWSLVKIYPYQDIRGQKNGIVVLIVNVNEVQALKESSRWISQFVYSQDSFKYYTDVNGTITKWSKGAEKFFNISRSEAEGVDESLLFSLNKFPELKLIKEQIAKHQPVYLQDTLRLDGKDNEKEVSVVAQGEYDERGEVKEIVYHIFPTTGSEIVDGAKSEVSALRGILNTVPIPLVVFNSHGEFTYANEDASALLKVDLNEMLKMNFDESVWELRGSDKKLLEPHEYPFSRVMNGAEEVKNFVCYVKDGDGQLNKITVSGSPLKSGNDTVGSVFVFRKIK